MTINEEARAKVVCPICRSENISDCGHMVGSFDRTFCDCYGGAVVDHLFDFRLIIEATFLSHIKEGVEPSLKNTTIKELWESVNPNSDLDEDGLDLDGYVLQRLVIELLKDAGAHEPPGSLIVPGGPGMTSSMTELFAEEPSQVVDRALQCLSNEIREADAAS